MSSWPHLRYLALVPRLTCYLPRCWRRQNGGNIQLWLSRGRKKDVIESILKDLKLESLIPKFASNRAWKCVRVVRWETFTSWPYYDRRPSSSPCPLCKIGSLRPRAHYAERIWKWSFISPVRPSGEIVHRKWSFSKIQNGGRNGVQLKPCYAHAHGCTQAFLPPVIVAFSDFSGVVWKENILSVL